MTTIDTTATTSTDTFMNRTPTPAPVPAPPTAERVGTVVGAAYGLVALASSATAVVVPQIRDDFGTSLADGAWVITAFVVALAASAAIYGRFADLVGTRLPFTIGLSVMAAGALAAALAPNLAMLIVARAIQGAGAGAVPVLAPAVIAARTSPKDRPQALTRMSALAAAAAAGLLVGALIAEAAGWRPVLALPVLGVLLVPAVRRLAAPSTAAAPTRRELRTRLHLAGAVAVVAVAVGINVALQLRADTSTGSIGIALTIFGVAVGVSAWRRTSEPFLPTAVLGRPLTWRLAATAATIPAAYFALLIAVPALLAARHDATRIETGALLFPAALAGVAVGPLARRLRTRLSGPRAGALGITTAAAALLTAAATVDTPVGLAVAFALAAVSFGIGQAAMLNELTLATPPAERGAALSVFMIVFFVGGGIGATLLSVLADSMSLTVALTWLAALPAAAAVIAATTTPAAS
jgi:MFS family permease